MEIHLKINDVVGMDDQKRHILRVDCEEIRRMLKERKLWEQLLDNPDIRNTIYMQEKAKREAKDEKRRREEQHKASIAYRKCMNFYRDILGIDDEEGLSD